MSDYHVYSLENRKGYTDILRVVNDRNHIFFFLQDVRDFLGKDNFISAGIFPKNEIASYKGSTVVTEAGLFRYLFAVPDQKQADKLKMLVTSEILPKERQSEEPRKKKDKPRKSKPSRKHHKDFEPELVNLARPLINYLRREGAPHDAIIITQSNAKHITSLVEYPM